MTDFQAGDRVRTTYGAYLGQGGTLMSRVGNATRHALPGWLIEFDNGERQTWPECWFEKISAVDRLGRLAND